MSKHLFSQNNILLRETGLEGGVTAITSQYESRNPSVKSIFRSHLVSPLGLPPVPEAYDADINQSTPSSHPQLQGGQLMLLPPE